MGRIARGTNGNWRPTGWKEVPAINACKNIKQFYWIDLEFEFYNLRILISDFRFMNLFYSEFDQLTQSKAADKITDHRVKVNSSFAQRLNGEYNENVCQNPKDTEQNGGEIGVKWNAMDVDYLNNIRSHGKHARELHYEKQHRDQCERFECSLFGHVFEFIR